MVTAIDRTWAAGLFEGEGTIAIAVRNSDHTYRLICSVGSTDVQIVNFFHERWGGWHQPMYGVRPGRKRGWTWTVAGPAAESFLESIRPFVVTLRVRRKLLLAMDFRKAQSRNKKAHAAADYKNAQVQIYREMKILNRRGVTPA